MQSTMMPEIQMPAPQPVKAANHTRHLAWLAAKGRGVVCLTSHRERVARCLAHGRGWEGRTRSGKRRLSERQ